MIVQTEKDITLGEGGREYEFDDPPATPWTQTYL